MEEGGYYFLSDHWERISQGLYWQWGESHLKASLPDDLFSCLKDGQGAGRKKVRLTFFQDREGESHWLLTFSTQRERELSPLKLKMALHPHLARQRPGYVKVGCYSECLRVCRQAKREGFDDVLFWSPEQGVGETTFSNIFFFNDGEAFTPCEREGMLSGITRHHFIQFLKSQEIIVHQDQYEIDKIKEAQSVVLTSSVVGIASVGNIETQSYENWQWPLKTYQLGWKEYRRANKTVL